MNTEEISKAYKDHSYYILRAAFVDYMSKEFKVELHKIEQAFKRAIPEGDISIILLLPNDNSFTPLLALLKMLGYGVIYDSTEHYISPSETVNLAVYSKHFKRFVVSLMCKTDTKELNELDYSTAFN